MAWQDTLISAATGAAAGGLVTVVVWAVVSKKLDQQFNTAAAEMLTRGEAELQRSLRETLDQEIPQRVGAQIDQSLREAGIDRESGERLSRLLAAADRVGLIGLRGRRAAVHRFYTQRML